MYSSFSSNVRPFNANSSVKVTLECVRPGVNLKFPTRELKLTLDSPSVTIGRASKNSSKNLQSDTDNAFFDCAVMSREHARVYLSDGLQGPVMIRDIKSLHGTYVNNSERITDAVALHSGDTLKFGDQIARMQDLHHGVEVRVSLSRPPKSSFAISNNTISARSAVPSEALKANRFEVPDASDDDISNQGCIDEDEDEATPSDDDEDNISLRDATLVHAFPLSKSFVDDEKRRVSGLSQLDPVVIDDEDMADLVKTTSPAVSPPRRLSDAQRAEFPGFGSEEENSEVEYAALDDDAVPSPPFSDDGGDDESVISGGSSPRVPFSRRVRKWSSAHSDGEVSDVNEADAADSGCDASPDKTVAAATSTAPMIMSMLDSSPDVSFKHTSTEQTSCYPNSRTLPKPEALAPPSKMQISDILAPVSTFTGTTRFDVLPRSVTMNSEPSHYLSNVGSSNKADETAPSYSAYMAFNYPFGDKTGAIQEVSGGLNTQVGSFDTQWSPQGQCPTAMSPMVTTQEAYMQETVDLESKKRKRSQDEDETGDVMDEGCLVKAGDSAKVAAAVDDGVNSASTSQLLDQQEAEEAPKQSGLCRLPLNSNLVQPLEDAEAEKDKKVKESRKAQKKQEGRPTKRARTSSISLALTAAAAGAVGGCVATVSFLWSPLAERLLA